MKIYNKLDKAMVNVVEFAKKFNIVTTDSCSGHKGGSITPYIGVSVKDNHYLKHIITNNVKLKHSDTFIDISFYCDFFANRNFPIVTYPKNRNGVHSMYIGNYNFKFRITHEANSDKYFFYLYSIKNDDYLNEDKIADKYFLHGYIQSVKDYYVEMCFIMLLTELSNKIHIRKYNDYMKKFTVKEDY